MACCGRHSRAICATMKILLIDDHALFREGLALLLSPLVQTAEVWEAGSCEQAFELLALRGTPDLTLLDLGLPGLSGLQGLALLRERHPELPVVVMSSADDRDTVLASLDGGAMGFIPKSSSSAVMLSALRLVLARGIYLPPSAFLSGREDRAPPAVPAASQSAELPGRHARELGLSPRQIEVLELILQGKSAKLIGRELGLSAGTVKAHTTAVLRALNVTTRTQAVIQAGKFGLRFGAA